MSDHDIKRCRCGRAYSDIEKKLLRVSDDLKNNNLCVKCMAQKYPDESVLQLVAGLEKAAPKFWDGFKK